MYQLSRGTKWGFAGLTAATLILAGCGGGGGSDSGGSASGTTRAALNVYVTDGFTDRYRQVLATLYKIEVTTNGTDYTTVFSEDAGRTLDLSSLSDTAELVASLNVAAGTYSQVRVTFGDSFTVTGRDGTSETIAVADGVGERVGSQIVLTLDAGTNVKPGQDNTLLVDFKLAEFQLIGGKVRPSITGNTGAAGCAGKRRTGNLTGTVSGLVAGSQFTLTTKNGRTLTVTLSDTTSVTAASSGAAIELADGQSVSVEGTPNETATSIAATSVTVLDGATKPQRQEVSGTVASVNADAGSFTLTVARARGFAPTGGTITVQTSDTTRYSQGRRSSATFSSIVVDQSVRVSGTFDSSTQTFAARGVSFKSAAGKNSLQAAQ